MAIHYALIHKDPRSDYGVSFPDFPGCVTGGATLDEAYRLAVEALAGHAGAMRADGDPIPDPSPLDVVRRHADARDAETTIGVPLATEEPAVRVNISLPANELRAIDSAAERRGMTRSGFLAHAARNAIGGFRERAAAYEPRRGKPPGKAGSRKSASAKPACAD